MKTEKLDKVKAALRLVVEQGEKANVGRLSASYFDYETTRLYDGASGRVADFKQAESHKLNPLAVRIATACNLDAPLAKALLLAIEGLERDANAYVDFLNPAQIQRQISAASRLESILNQFPDEP